MLNIRNILLKYEINYIVMVMNLYFNTILNYYLFLKFKLIKIHKINI
jgi:hypothetical protein